MNRVTGVIRSMLNLLYPLHCAACGIHLASADSQGVCDDCRARIRRNPAPYCQTCGRPMPNTGMICAECVKMQPVFASARSACLYEGPLKDLVLKFKYKNRRSLLGLFTVIMMDFLRDNNDIMEGVEAIAFVPLHKKKRLERGINQSELIAASLGRYLGIPVINALEKKRKTKNQNELSRFERLTNLKDAFSVSPEFSQMVKDRDILIIDDVMTTGSTLNEAAKPLLTEGARRVRCYTLARGS